MLDSTQGTLLWFQMLMLAAARLMLGLAMTPLFSAFYIPMQARLIVILVLAGLAVDTPGVILINAHAGLDYLIPALVRELGLGLMLSIGVHTAFSAFAIAGRLLDTQLGFTFGSVLDPVSKGHVAVISSGLNLLAVVLFFVTDAHQLVLSGYFKTFELLPIGQAWSTEAWLPAIMTTGAMFSMGFVMAAPVVIALLLADVAVAVLVRNLPQMNLLFLSIPLKILLGLSIMAITVHFLSHLASTVLAFPITLLDKVQ